MEKAETAFRTGRRSLKSGKKEYPGYRDRDG